MTKISQKQVEAVSALSGPKRYSHFVKVVADTETAWGLWQEGWAMVGTEDGGTAFPLWPQKVYATRCAVGQWSGYEAAEIEVESLLDELLPMLAADGVLPAVFMTPGKRGAIPEGEVLIADLRAELSRF